MKLYFIWPDSTTVGTWVKKCWRIIGEKEKIVSWVPSNKNLLSYVINLQKAYYVVDCNMYSRESVEDYDP